MIIRAKAKVFFFIYIYLTRQYFFVSKYRISYLLPFWNHIYCYFGYNLLEMMNMERINQRTDHIVGTNIRKLRLEKGLKNKEIVTQLQLRGVDISTGTYSKVETGRNNPSVDLLIALTDILSCSFDSFFQK